MMWQFEQEVDSVIPVLNNVIEMAVIVTRACVVSFIPFNVPGVALCSV